MPGMALLSDCENELETHVRESAVGQRIRQVGTLPALPADRLVKQFQTDAPAVYFSLVKANPKADTLEVAFRVIVIASNAGGHRAARQGDKAVIGLHELLVFVMALLNIAELDSANWHVSQGAKSTDLYTHGLYGAAFIISAEVTMPELLDVSTLDDFITFDAQYDIEPHETEAEHLKWLQEPPDHTTSAPDLEDELTDLDA